MVIGRRQWGVPKEENHICCRKEMLQRNEVYNAFEIILECKVAPKF